MNKKLRLGQWKWKSISLALLLQLSVIAVVAQVRISGKVTGADGKGIPAVSVQIRTTTVGTITDANGNYDFTATLKSGTYILDFTGVGFKSKEQSVQVGDAASYTVDAQLAEDILKMDEVVVTGVSAGTTRKQLGSYVSTVKADQLNKGAAANPLLALQGKTLGAQITQNNGDPAGGFSVRLRGISSISGSSEPLYIVDGVIVNNASTRVTNTQGGYDGANVVGTIGQNRMVDINPADIERIEVLNGAAAAAIYGSRANAGVVQIFTKRGKSGAPVVSFSSGIVFSSLRKKLEVNNSPTKFGGPTDGPTAQTQDVLTPTLTNTTAVSRYDYQDYIFRNAMGTDNNVSVSGGTDKTKYLLSGSYFKNEGIVNNTDFQRFSFRTNIDQAIGKYITATMGLNYINSDANEKPDGNSFYSPMNSVTIIGNFHDIKTRDALGNIKAVGERGRANPVSVIEDIKQKNQTSRIIGNFGLKIKPVKDLSIDYTMGIDNYVQKGTTFIPPFAYNVSTAFFGGGISLDPTQNGYASAATSLFFGINHDLNATYTKGITKNITSTTQIGFSQQYEKQSYQMSQGRGLAPFVETVNGASTLLNGIDDRGELSISGFFIQENLRYKDQLFITGALRRDGSSLYSGSQRNQTYAKASVSYLLSSTGFWNKSSIKEWWDLFKVRLAYGESGNLTGIGATDRFNLYTSSSFVGRTTLSSSTRAANPNVGPERQQELEFGTDLGFFNNRLGITLNVYNKKVQKLSINRQVAPTTGFSSLLDNVGNLENKGFEIMLSGVPVRIKDFSWSISGIYNHNRNKLVNSAQPLILFATNGGAPIALIEGQPIGVFYGTFFATTPGGSFEKDKIGVPVSSGLVLGPTGIPRTAYGTQSGVLSYTQSDYLPGGFGNQGIPQGVQLRKIIGDPNPDYTASITNEFNYKKLSLRVQIDITHGNEVFNADFRTRQGVGNGKIVEMEQKGLLPRGTVSVYGYSAAITYPTGIYGIEEWRVDDGSNTRIRELSLSYSLGKVAKWINDLSLSFTGRNLKVWTKYIGYDPEVNAAGQSTLLRGIDFGSVPLPKTFSFGVQAKF
jgi:TonB-linked SusC/RagA family outer membrane protein